MTATGKIRLRRIIWIILITGCLSLGILLTHAILHRAPSYHRAYNKGIFELRNRNMGKALDHFRYSVQENPDFLDARRSVIRTLMTSKEFDEAESEIQAAIEVGLTKSEAAYFRADIGKARALHRVNSVGEKATAQVYTNIISSEIDPVIEKLRTHMETFKDPTQAYTLLGELFEQKGTILTLKQRALFAERETALKLEHSREVAMKDFEITRVLSEIRSARLHSLNAFYEAIELNPKATAPRLAAANYAITRYVPQPDLARDLITPLLENDPSNSNARRTLTAIERLEGNYETALKHIRLLRQKRPQDLMLAVDEIEVLFSLDRWEETLPLVQNLTLLAPNDPRVHYVRGRLLIHQGKHDDAAKALERIFLQEAINWPEARILLAKSLLASSKTEQAIATFEDTIKDIDSKQAPSMKMYERFQEIRYDCYVSLSKLVAETNPKAAANHAKHAFDVFRDRQDAYHNVRKAYITAGYRDQVPSLAVMHISAVDSTQGSETALRMCRNEIKNLDNSPALRKLEAALLMREGRFTEAFAAIENMGQDFPNDSTYLRALAKLHIKLGHVEEARKTYEAILERDPYDSSAISALLGLLTGSGQMDEVRNLLERVEDKLGPQKRRTLHMNLALAEKRPEEAIQLASAHTHANPFSAPAHELLAMLLWQTGDLAKARVSFNNALALDPAYRMAYRRGLLDMEEGKFQDAIELFGQAIERMPDFPAVRLHLALALGANGELNEAISTLENVQKNILNPGPQDDAVRWFLALLYASEGNLQQAQFYNKRVKSMPFITILDRKSFLERLAHLKAPDKHAATTALTLSSIFVRNGCLNSAQAQLRRLQALLPHDPLVACWLAQLHNKQSQYLEATTILDRTIAENPTFVTARVMLAETHVQAANLDKAAEILVACLDIAKGSRLAKIYLRLASIQNAIGLHDTAIENFRLAMQDSQTEASACAEIAWLLTTVKANPEQAIPYARRSLELRPDDPAVLDTLGWALFLSGDIGAAVEHIERAKRGLPSNPTVRYHLAQAYLKAGQKANAKIELTESLAISDTFPDASEARRLLEQL